MKKYASFIILSSAFGLFSANAGVDCISLALSVKHAAAAEKSRVLEIVSKEVSSAPACACEIVKAAIEGSAANSKTVAAIVQSAAIAAPDQMRLVSQCAVAVAPDALADVQSVIALMDPNLGESDKVVKSDKAPAGEVASAPNPLDFPGSTPLMNAGGTGAGAGGQGFVGPSPGSAGGLGMFPYNPVPGNSGSGGIGFVPAPGAVTTAPTGSPGGASGSGQSGGNPNNVTDGNFPVE